MPATTLRLIGSINAVEKGNGNRLTGRKNNTFSGPETVLGIIAGANAAS